MLQEVKLSSKDAFMNIKLAEYNSKTTSVSIWKGTLLDGIGFVPHVQKSSQLSPLAEFLSFICVEIQVVNVDCVFESKSRSR